MRIFVSNVLVFVGALLLIASYYYMDRYVRRLWRRYLSYYERGMEKYKGWLRDFHELNYVIMSSGQSAYPVVSAIISYLLIGFGIISSMRLIDSDTSALIYAYIICAAMFAYNFILLIFEKNREARRLVRFIRIVSMNTVVTSALILGAALRKDGFPEIIAFVPAFYIVVNLGLVLPVFNRFWKSDKE